MKKTYKDRMIVNEWFVDALIQLMDNKTLSKITITELTKKAGVPRATFYRYFNEKEDILTKYSEYLTELLSLEYREKLPDEDPVFILFSFLKQHRKYLKILVKNHKQDIILNAINQNIEEMMLDDKNKLIASYHAGGIYNIIVEWIKSDFKESPFSLSKEIIHLINSHYYKEIIQFYTSTFKKLS